jgi:organic hydroperoxide reductase OsmC/OhrA
MKPLPHTYTVTVAGGPSGYAALSASGVPAVSTAPPLEFDGPGDAWSPEQLFLGAVATCFLFTLRSVGQASRIAFVALDLTVDGTVDKQDGITRFTEIVLRPRLSLPPGEERERALRLLDKSKRACLVTASLAAPIRLEPEIDTD